MKTVYDLTREELNELKEAYLIQIAEDEELSYGELCESERIPDDIIINHYAEIIFSSDDFFCNQNA